MKTAIRVILSIACFAIDAGAFDSRTDVLSGNFTSESHPGDQNNIRKIGNNVGYIANGTWIAFQDFDFGDGVEYLWIEGAAPDAGGAVEMRLGSDAGPSIGSVAITNTGSWDTYKPFAVKISGPVVGVQNLFLKFTGGSGYLFNLGKFRFQRFAPDYQRPGTITARIKRDPAAAATPAGGFTSESHPNNDGNVRSEGGNITYISNGQWVGYAGYDFGAGANFVTIQGASQNAGGTVELRLGDATTGTLIGSVSISGTGAWNNYQPFNAALTQTLTGVQNLYFRFVGGGGYLYNLGNFRFQQLEPEAKSVGRLVAAHQFDRESSPGVDPIAGADGITSLTGGAWVAYNGFNFGQGADLITVTAATPTKGGGVEVRLDTPGGPLLATMDVTHTGSLTLYREYTAAMSQTISGSHDLYLKFIDSHTQGGGLFNLRNFILEKKAAVPPAPSNEGTLLVYDPVTGLDPSPYYSYSVQEASELNAPLKQNATNWLSPFAWFSECKGYGDPYHTAYYANEIAGWSHTYCNFEMGRNTPIVVKITRQGSNPYGAPAGPITMANVHPAHKVQSCEIINGEVYVTMSEPALVTVDIDGQMDARDAPRSHWSEQASSKPYASRQKGSHAVSIFANPVIADKPVIGAPGVIVINPGDPLPAYNDSSWHTLYFAKGVHHFSRNPDGSPGIWKNGDAYILMSDKTCYIPGDAMIYGNFDGNAESSPKNRVRIYGYGTISGARMPHWDDPYWDEPAQAGTNYRDRPISMSSGYDCRFEGVTLADPANHGVAFDWGGGNLRRWMKQVSWRANSDMGGIPGVVEDCFFRLQDDGPYVSGNDFRRNTLWFDCNGSPFRGTFIKRGTVGAGHQTVIEDCDIIYVRSNWGGSVMGTGDYWETGTYPDGTKNTAQHVIFRNIRVTDPRPTRTLFGFGVPDGASSGIAGTRFENIEYRHPHSWGSQSSFTGTATAPIHHCYFDGVFIEGRQMNAGLLADPSLFVTSNISDFVFRDGPDSTPDTYNLLTSATNGSITLNPPGGVYLPGTEVTVSATPGSGHRFESWGGDLQGAVNPATITVDRNKSISALFTPVITGATINTSGGTTLLNIDVPQNTYIGDGTLRVSTDGSPAGQIFLGADGSASTVFAMTGGQITIDSGVSLVNGGWAKGVWTQNKADLVVNGTLDLWNGNPVWVDALSGAGSIVFGYPWAGTWDLHVGADGGGGTYSGSIEGTNPYSGNSIRIFKEGAGTQVFDNLANQKPGTMVLNEGVVELATATAVTMTTNFSGAGSLTKSGAGVLTLSGSLGNTGVITVSGGTLGVSSGLTNLSNLVVASGAMLKLNHVGEIVVNSLKLGVSGALPAGVYSSSHPDYGSFFTGAGSLRIAGGAYETWAGTNGVADGSPEDDPDGDGIRNLLEYVLGGDPRKPGTEFLPKRTIEGTDLVLTYQRNDASEGDTIQAGQWSADLQNWSAVDVTIELVSENGTGPDDMKMRIPLSKAIAGRLFARLQVIKP